MRNLNGYVHSETKDNIISISVGFFIAREDFDIDFSVINPIFH